MLSRLLKSGQSRQACGNDIGTSTGVITGHVDVGLTSILRDLSKRGCFGAAFITVLGVVEEGV